VDFQDIVDFCQAQALANKLEPTEDSVWRSLCRSYSKNFNTPLHLVLEMSPEYVITHVYEERYSDINEEEQLDKLLDMIYSLADPEYEKQQREETVEFMAQAEAEEAERIRLGKPIHPALKKEHSLKDLPEEEPKPTSGSINLSYLEKEELED
jgi:hypothetical protein